MDNYIEYLKSQKPLRYWHKKKTAYFLFTSKDEQFLHIDFRSEEDGSVIMEIGYTGGIFLISKGGVRINSVFFLKELLSSLTYVRQNFPLLFQENTECVNAL